MNYELLKKILFLFEPEKAHALALKSLSILNQIKLTSLLPSMVIAKQEIMGLHFPNRVGLAAGLDKNGDYIDALGALGFGFIEVGTVTPLAQAGNPLPRLFRLPQQEAIINRMGFNNKGVDYLVERLKKTTYQGILGVNIGKGKETPIEHALDDYLYALDRVLPFAKYVTINISSPNTENLRQLQHADLLQTLLRNLKKTQASFFQTHHKYVPLVVKVAPDLSPGEINDMAAIFLSEKIDGMIATNTTIHRDGLSEVPLANEKGGLSGKPLFTRSTDVLKHFHHVLGGKIPIIASGGISSVANAREKMKAGASLVQLYSGFIYHGPLFIRQLANAMAVTEQSDRNL
jgi:dihydroorotate dehydrogenase